MVSFKLLLANLFSLVAYLLTSYQSHPAALRSPHTTLPLAHLHLQHFRQRSHAPRNLLLVEARKSKAQRVRQGTLHVEVAARGEQHAALLYVNQKLARVEPRRQLQPHAHPAFRHVLSQSFVKRRQPRGVHLAHFPEVLTEEPASQKLR